MLHRIVFIKNARDSTSLKNKEIFQSKKAWLKCFKPIKSALYALYHLFTKAIHSMFKNCSPTATMCAHVFYVQCQFHVPSV